MPFYAKKRLRFGEGWVERNKPVPVVEGRDYRKMERLGLIAWSKDELSSSVAAIPPKKAAAPKADTIDTVVAIPENWRDLPWLPKKAGEPSLRVLASQIGAGPIKNKVDAIAAIEAEAAKRAGGQPDISPAVEVVAIPEEWGKLDWQQRVALANALKVVDETIVDGEEADAMIELEIERRKAEADGQSA